jgi:hypothetical protein
LPVPIIRGPDDSLARARVKAADEGRPVYMVARDRGGTRVWVFVRTQPPPAEAHWRVAPDGVVGFNSYGRKSHRYAPWQMPT